MEVATRRRGRSRKCVNVLGKCIEYDVGMSMTERMTCQSIKTRSVKLFAPEHGGSYEVFNSRPLSSDLMDYCVQDVRLLSNLWYTYNKKLSPSMRQRVLGLSQKRVAESQEPSFILQGRHLALAPVF